MERRWRLFSVTRIFKTLLFCITHTDRYRRAPAAGGVGPAEPPPCRRGRHSPIQPAPGMCAAGWEEQRRRCAGEERCSRHWGDAEEPSHPTPLPCRGGGPGCMPGHGCFCLCSSGGTGSAGQTTLPRKLISQRKLDVDKTVFSPKQVCSWWKIFVVNVWPFTQRAERKRPVQEQPSCTGNAGTGRRDPRARRHRAPREPARPLLRGSAKPTLSIQFLGEEVSIWQIKEVSSGEAAVARAVRA